MLFNALLSKGNFTMKITVDEVRKVAILAKLTLSETDIERMATDMDAMLVYVATLANLDTEGIVPTAHAVPMANAFRADQLRPSLEREEVMAAAPKSANGTFRVPKVIE
jgi:aspartyl-tRNA(Asn)/glutamyl-tRNA(Gln) amidotransferase subunit C